MGDVTSGKRAAPRHAGPARLDHGAGGAGGHGGGHGAETGRSVREHPRDDKGPLLLLALGITATVVAWGYLVYLAIDFGGTARDGDGTAWWFLALATIGAIACLFVAMMLGTRLVTRFRASSAAPSPPPRPPGGRRAAR
jgi:hypothetical protein